MAARGAQSQVHPGHPESAALLAALGSRRHGEPLIVAQVVTVPRDLAGCGEDLVAKAFVSGDPIGERSLLGVELLEHRAEHGLIDAVLVPNAQEFGALGRQHLQSDPLVGLARGFLIVPSAAEALHGPLAASDVALLLARAKAEDVCRGGGPAAYQPCVVLGCDSVLELDGEVHGKPGDDAEAIARWRRMRGRTGTLHTGHWLVDERESSHGGTGGMVGGTASTVVHFADLDDAEIEAYVATGEPLRVAGAFTIDGLGGAFVTAIEGDHHNVVGLSLPLLRELVREVGVGWFDLV